MNIYYQKQRWKLFLFLFAICIGVGSLLYTKQLVRTLAEEEHKKIELWAEATKKLADINLDDQNEEIQSIFYGFLLQVLQNNETIPVMLVDDKDNILQARNLDSLRMDNQAYLQRQLKKMKSENEPIKIIYLGEGLKQYIYYRNSTLLMKLTFYPYFQMGVVLLFILVSYFAFSEARKAEQNLVWVGLSKETAHQLGTPTSSLMAWAELLKEKSSDKELVKELEKDIKRLEKITERFSKIGSPPILRKENIIDVIKRSIEYLESRTSDKINYRLIYNHDELTVPINAALFEWVVENLCKNSIDAMEGTGTIEISVTDNTRVLYVDIHDRGKGIPKSKHKTIFKPGFTTKQRGWGLGLSLAKRIIETYHAGKIFVYQSDQEKGTTFRIVLRK